MYSTFDTVDFNDPEQHFAAALINVPGLGPGGVGIPPAWAAIISKHLVEIGYVWAPWLARLADANGKIDINDLPKQTKKLQRPMRGPVNVWNPATQWVPMDTPDPELIVLPSPDAMTVQERSAMLDLFKAGGYLPEPEEPTNFAEEL
ncbi:phage gene 29 protein family protein [Nocardia terpenica]|uniref:Minor tail protein n=1 Tax=Nocardia terpenica TaxID=455432 RepID=A0A164LAR5_9NOCA|nr:DUF2744 domain-containing protein [Nocardia terpenica]KZM72197.1 hypothetical protein AWN90_36585 [Nocardia terpenica]NQE86659.1 DUF2744 domain-containing protein [Nocardia terpenica]